MPCRNVLAGIMLQCSSSTKLWCGRKLYEQLPFWVTVYYILILPSNSSCMESWGSVTSSTCNPSFLMEVSHHNSIHNKSWWHQNDECIVTSLKPASYLHYNNWYKYISCIIFSLLIYINLFVFILSTFINLRQCSVGVTTKTAISVK